MEKIHGLTTEDREAVQEKALKMKNEGKPNAEIEKELGYEFMFMAPIFGGNKIHHAIIWKKL